MTNGDAIKTHQQPPWLFTSLKKLFLLGLEEMNEGAYSVLHLMKSQKSLWCLYVFFVIFVKRWALF